ncbi:flagellar hook assembly protein FlgD [Buchnera aphidicola]|uniref:flagellar hook assembly protein FlgD n=1 Tax=Buchnera aphidicola TaxID=9 RepID=UPI003463CC7B
MSIPVNFFFKKNAPMINIDVNNNLLKNNNQLDLKNNFLNIFLAQIKNQDPTDPLKNNDLTSQLAQINMDNGITNINKTLSTILENVNQQKLIRSSELIGRGILFPNSTITHDGKKDTIFGVDIPKDISSADIVVNDKNGKILFLKKVGHLKSGVHSFTWNGINNNGKKVNNETYHISIYTKNKNKIISYQPLKYAVIHGIINLTNKETMIDLGKLGMIEFKNIRKIF